MVMGPPRSGRKIIYTGDTRPILAELAENGEFADLLIHDATFDDGELERAKEFMHATAGEAGRTASSLQVSHLALFHLSSRYTSYEKHLTDAKKFFSGEISAPDDLVMIEIPFRDDPVPGPSDR
jgi:ribonuclease Z